jgi:iron complex transport system permease protein
MSQHPGHTAAVDQRVTGPDSDPAATVADRARRGRLPRPVLVIALLAIAAVVAALAGATTGSVPIPVSDLVRLVTSGHASDPTTTVLLTEIRLPRAATAAVVGAGLAVAGLLMQTVFANPLADPYVLGVSSGASLGVALVTLTSASVAGGFTELAGGSRAAVPVAAAAGSILVLLLILLFGRWVRSVITLLIVGVMLSSVIGAITSLLVAFADPQRLQQYVLWGLGSYSGVTNADLVVLAPVVVAAIAASGLIVRALNAMLLGENYARSLGVRVTAVRVVAMLITAVIAGATTAYCGPIAFLGMAVPHLARLVIGTSDHRLLAPATVLMGVIVSSICSVIAQLPGTDAVLPINVCTALVGAPVVLAVLLRSRRLTAGAV